MIENTTLNSVVTDLIAHRIRNYVLQYYPAGEQLTMQSCKGNNASAVNGLVVTIAELLEADWDDKLETQERMHGKSEKQIVADEFMAMMLNPMIHMHVDSACFQLAVMIVSTIVCGPIVREAANECLNCYNLKA